MCLLVFVHRREPHHALVVLANRDEFLERPSVNMAVLRPSSPRILGGQDLRAGGTWMAVNENGLVAGLTNRRISPDPRRRSRGELPMELARHRTARAAADWIRHHVTPGTYNPCWLLVGDGTDLFHADLSDDTAVRVESLPEGVHVLENRPLSAESPKAAAVSRAVEGARRPSGELDVRALFDILALHDVPADARLDPEGRWEGYRFLELAAPCVHLATYGTRTALVARIHQTGHPPELWYTDGPPCRTAPEEVSAWFNPHGARGAPHSRHGT